MLDMNCSEQESSTGAASCSEGEHTAPKPQAMGHKNDLIVWLQLHPAQRHVYEASFATWLDNWQMSLMSIGTQLT